MMPDLLVSIANDATVEEVHPLKDPLENIHTGPARVHDSFIMDCVSEYPAFSDHAPVGCFIKGWR